jgi:hypothetical protein
LVAGSSPKRQGDAWAVWQLVVRFRYSDLHERPAVHEAPGVHPVFLAQEQKRSTTRLAARASGPVKFAFSIAMERSHASFHSMKRIENSDADNHSRLCGIPGDFAAVGANVGVTTGKAFLIGVCGIRSSNGSNGFAPHVGLDIVSSHNGVRLGFLIGAGGDGVV